MLRIGPAALVAAVLATLSCDAARAHGLQTGSEAAAAGGDAFAVTVSVDPAAALPRVLAVPLGAHVRLTVTGAEGAALHLHGYDIEAGGDGEPAVLRFHAAHEGRFPVETHIEDDLLGQRGKPVLFIEVRGN